jgi:hypothetical protein
VTEAKRTEAPGPPPRNDRNVGGDHRGDLRIASRRLRIGQQHDRLTRPRNLDCACHSAVGHNIVTLGVRELRTVEPKAHAVGLHRDRIGGREQGVHGRVGEVILLRTKHDPDRLVERWIVRMPESQFRPHVHVVAADRQDVADIERATLETSESMRVYVAALPRQGAIAKPPSTAR